MPASSEYVEYLVDALLNVPFKSSSANFDHYWRDMLQISTDKPVTHSMLPLQSTVEMDLNASDMFGSCSEDAGRMLMTFDKAKLEWGHRVDKDLTLRRLVLDGGDILVLMDGIKIEVIPRTKRVCAVIHLSGCGSSCQMCFGRCSVRFADGYLFTKL